MLWRHWPSQRQHHKIMSSQWAPEGLIGRIQGLLKPITTKIMSGQHIVDDSPTAGFALGCWCANPHASISACAKGQNRGQRWYMYNIVQWFLYLWLVRHQKRAPCRHCWPAHPHCCTCPRRPLQTCGLERTLTSQCCEHQLLELPSLCSLLLSAKSHAYRFNIKTVRYLSCDVTKMKEVQRTLFWVLHLIYLCSLFSFFYSYSSAVTWSIWIYDSRLQSMLPRAFAK